MEGLSWLNNKQGLKQGEHRAQVAGAEQQQDRRQRRHQRQA